MSDVVPLGMEHWAEKALKKHAVYKTSNSKWPRLLN
jgi:hypothetical protein